MNDQDSLNKENISSGKASANATVLTRPATSDELKLLELNRAFHEHRLRQKFGWKTPVISSILLIGLSYGMYVTEVGTGFGWFFFFWIIAVFLIWDGIYSSRQEKKQSRKMLKDIAAFDKHCYVEVQIHKCNRALFIPDPEDLGNIHLLEIGENQLLCWHEDFEEIGLLPVTEFEVYVNTAHTQLFNQRLRIIGDRFQAVSITLEASWDAYDDLPEHGKVIAGTVDNFLAQLTQRYRVK